MSEGFEVKQVSYTSRSNSPGSIIQPVLIKDSPGKESLQDSIRITRCVLNDTFRVSRVPRQIECSEIDSMHSDEDSFQNTENVK